MITTKPRRIDVNYIKTSAAGRWPEILSAAGFPAEILDSKHHACPKCGGKDRFRLINKEDGSVLCNQCFGKDNGDGIAAVMWMRGVSFGSVPLIVES